MKFAPKRSAQNGPATKWAATKWSRHKVMYPSSTSEHQCTTIQFYFQSNQSGKQPIILSD